MTDAEGAKTKTLEAKCFCGSVHLTFDVAAASLPLATYLCHCSLCRYTTGSPCVFHARLPEGLQPRFMDGSTEDKMTSYVAEGSSCSYDFCATCGCHIGGVSLDRQQWTVATSIFTDHGPDRFKIAMHVFDKSAKGGGIAPMLTRMGDGEMASWNPPDDHPSAKLVESDGVVGADGQDRLRAECHCGGVSFTIRRPTQKVLKDSFMSHYVSPRATNRWKAVLDMCNDCRLVTGTHVVGWAFVPLCVCEPPVDTTLRIGTAKTFSSSEGVLRSFCGVCGATVFFTKAKRQPTAEQAVVDVACGILRAPEGVMAEDWLDWRAHPSFAASGRGYDKAFGEALGEGLKKWTKERYGEELEFEV